MNKGFTLIEVIVATAILGILASFLYTGYERHRGGERQPTYEEPQSISSLVCEGGFRFVSDNGSMKQVLDEKGNGVPCK